MPVQKKLSDATAVRPDVSPVFAELMRLSPEVARLHDKRLELDREEAEIWARLKPAGDELRKQGAPPWVRHRSPTVKPEPILPSPGVVERLGDLAPEPRMPPGPHKPPVAALHDECDQLSHRLDDVLASKAALFEPGDKRYSKYEAALRAASKLRREELRPEYSELATRLCDAMVQLVEVACEHDDWLRHNCPGDYVVMTGLRPVQIPDAVGDPRQVHGYSEIARLVAFAVECGHFAKDKLPDTWLIKGTLA